jgi:hypothetical protein
VAVYSHNYWCVSISLYTTTMVHCLLLYPISIINYSLFECGKQLMRILSFFLSFFFFLQFSLQMCVLLIQVDIGGHPPIPLGCPPLLLLVFQFLHSLLFLAVFRVLNFQSRFKALNDVFWENGKQHDPKVVVLE